MESSATKQAKEKTTTPSALTSAARHSVEPPLPSASPSPDLKAIGYGLPCSNCRAYYPSDLKACPVCKSTERVSPRAVVALPVAPIVASPESSAALEDDRERFLREL